LTSQKIDGIKWISQGNKTWLSEDGLWALEYIDDFTTECENPHPVKISNEYRKKFFATLPHERSMKFSMEVRFVIQEGKRGYYCEGGMTHYYGLWVSGAAPGTTGPEVIIRAETFKEAAQAVAEHLNTGKIWA
jgi:hypothetical protein